METKAQISSKQKNTLVGIERELVVEYNRDLNLGRKKSKRLCELLDHLECNLECEDCLNTAYIHSLRITPYDGKVLIYGSFIQEFESLDELAGRNGINEKCRILKTISEEVEGIRIKLPKS